MRGCSSTCRISSRRARSRSASSAPNSSSCSPPASRGPARRRQLYRAILDAAGDRPVTFRTLDIGGDKLLPYMKGIEEENPALGWRALRIGLDRPALLRMQFRAFIRAAAGRDLRVMAPMVSTVDEFKTARALFDRELSWSAFHGHEPPSSVSSASWSKCLPCFGRSTKSPLRRLSVGRLERSDAISFRRRSRQPPRGQPLRSTERRFPERPEERSSRRERARERR